MHYKYVFDCISTCLFMLVPNYWTHNCISVNVIEIQFLNFVIFSLYCSAIVCFICLDLKPKLPKVHLCLCAWYGSVSGYALIHWLHSPLHGGSHLRRQLQLTHRIYCLWSTGMRKNWVKKFKIKTKNEKLFSFELISNLHVISFELHS